MGSERISFDVVVVGAGNAALCAALSAREQGASVVVLEKAPPDEQGGNCPFTGGGFRFVHDGIEDIRHFVPDLTDDEVARTQMAPYTADDFRQHLTTVTHGDVDPELMAALIAESRPTVEWMHSKGVRWELSGRTSAAAGVPSVIPNAVGLNARESGPGLVQMLTKAARQAGITILYGTEMVRLISGEPGVAGVEARDKSESYEIECGAVILACGGFEANASMRAEHIGPGWESAKVRGSRHNTGDGHRAAMDLGAQPFGQWTGCHATPIDIEAPSVGDLRVTDRMPRRSYTLGITVNSAGLRFVDEGEGFAEQTFVKMGQAILEQPGGMAHQIFDSRALPNIEARYGNSKRVEAATTRELAAELGVDQDALEQTVASFNAGAHESEYAQRTLDGLATNALEPPKSNWAIKLDSPPFTAFTVTGGITYTYGGLKIDTHGRVLGADDRPIAGLYAAGEIVGGIFYHNSLRAAGLMHGSVFGKSAGAHAGAAVRRYA
ncbi:MAG: FAD-dependent tricarballylate dehydrogenase TcuA [SAR202 cluster bacterium]|jgi:tricarballylate dehydrogenase|nr:FAD-dependent tricarballylate dehydrogenase TcuA [SAR202 cluster bacterium]MDP6300089.1 FAD-dependent tricarballylate dehydrogenase TcuA [SAR202 cluster bacterium]MDP7225730.1 FAD-dependent tricarballylate dehydrogenase TcuA [SAR202 cluster bacterium]MDP7412283.1 FAD-dependent tricarballylate dehydrogenase TcuA [SAR202 cluster bacterium]MDP7534577.1 FAD-dependent tricarballylate dehydrogenase TcuA [SAR202 cluster bacterium]|tara:strand:- start:2677 stop:4161 length:1485 start_codon:yes stop_codon:yes gene_type:complete